MPVYKIKTGWRVRFQKKDLSGKYYEVSRSGFQTKKEALQWEAEQKMAEEKPEKLTLKAFIENCYLPNIRPRIKLSTYNTKVNIIEKHIIPFLGHICIEDLSKKDVMQWQNILLTSQDSDGNTYTRSFLKTIHNQLSAILNYAVKYHDLPRNVAAIVGNCGSNDECKSSYWTLEQYKKFASVMMDEPTYYYIFEVLFWTGIREGEMFALTLDDIDFDNKTISITKTLNWQNGHINITNPKTPQSVRVVKMPDFLCQELLDYLDASAYIRDGDSRLFTYSKSMLSRALKRGARKAGLPEIRVHDLRHSHVSMLISQGFDPVAIGRRIGHKSVYITYHYAHCYTSAQNKIADSLDLLNEEVEE